MVKRTPTGEIIEEAQPRPAVGDIPATDLSLTEGPTNPVRTPQSKLVDEQFLNQGRPRESIQQRVEPVVRNVNGRAAIFDPRRRGGTGLGAAAGSPTSFLEAETLKDSEDLINAKQVEAVAAAAAVPTRGTEVVAPPIAEPEPSVVTPEEDIAEINRVADERIAAIKAEPSRLAVQQAEISAIQTQAKDEVNDIKAAQKLVEDRTISKEVSDAKLARYDKLREQGVGSLAAAAQVEREYAALKDDPAKARLAGELDFIMDSEDDDITKFSRLYDAAKNAGSTDVIGDSYDVLKSRVGEFLAKEIKNGYLEKRGYDEETIKRENFATDIADLYSGNSSDSFSVSKFVSDAESANMPPQWIASQLEAINSSLSADSRVQGVARDFLNEPKYKRASDFELKQIGDTLYKINPETEEVDVLIKGSGSAKTLSQLDAEFYTTMTDKQRADYLSLKGELAKAGKTPSASTAVEVGEGTDFPNLRRIDLIATREFIRNEFGTRALERSPEMLPEFLNQLNSGNTLDDIADEFRERTFSTATINDEVYRQAFTNVASGINGKDNKETFLNEADRRLSDGDLDGVKDYVKLNALNSAGVDKRNSIMGSEFTIKFLQDIEEDLRDYEDSGGDTGIFSGNAEQIAAGVGEVIDPERREIATKIQAAIQSYRRSMSGVAFSHEESKEYSSMFPNIESELDLNVANLTALSEVMGLQVDNFYAQRITERVYNDIFKNIPPPMEDRKRGDTRYTRQDLIDMQFDSDFIESVANLPIKDQALFGKGFNASPENTKELFDRGLDAEGVVEFYRQEEESKKKTKPIIEEIRSKKVGAHGGQCTTLARKIEPTLPSGLWSKQDKIDKVVNGESGISKEEIASNPEVGDVIVTNDGEYGHVAVISKILNNNSVELVESNWKDDEKIGAGRVLALNSPSIEGGWRKG